MRVVDKRIANHSIESSILAFSPVRIVDSRAQPNRASLDATAIHFDTSDRDRWLRLIGLGREVTRSMGICLYVLLLFQFRADGNGLVIDCSGRNLQVHEQLQHLAGKGERGTRATKTHNPLQHRRTVQLAVKPQWNPLREKKTARKRGSSILVQTDRRAHREFPNRDASRSPSNFSRTGDRHE